MTASARLRAARVLRVAPVLALTATLGACGVYGDFGRPRPSLVTADMHAFVGTDAAQAAGVPVSKFPLTDEERDLRDLAFPLIEPPYNRDRWFSILREYGLNRIFVRSYEIEDQRYYSRLAGYAYRSATARYNKLNDDIRNDAERIAPFFGLARRVLDIDRKRQQSLAYVSNLTPAEKLNAETRITENLLIVAWVQQALADRARCYRYALERLVIETPTPMAVEAERSLQLMQQRIAENQVVAPLPAGTAGVPYPPPGPQAQVVAKP